MSAYPKYWVPQMPNQYQNVQPMPNPYMDRMNQLQQYQQNLQVQQPQYILTKIGKIGNFVKINHEY